MTTSSIRNHQGLPALFLNGQPVPPIVAYVGSRYLKSFRDADIQLFTFYVYGDWWLGPDQYDFSAIDAFIQEYISLIPGRYFMPRIDLAFQGASWWGQAHPQEMNVLRDIVTGEVRDQLGPNPKAIPYLGHDVELDKYNLHSFHSRIWREEAGRAVAALISHCEAQPYAQQIWAWHLCDGLFCEWFQWNEYSFDGMADYSPAAREDFRTWLRRTYQDDPRKLSLAWGRSIDFDSVQIPTPQERSLPARGEFYDPIRDRPTVDYHQCVSDAQVDSITAICQAAKQALSQPKVTCVFYGYQFSNMPRPQLNAHYALQRLLASPDVDMISSPHTYNNRGEGGYHSTQTPVDSIRRAGKIHFDEIDCKTVWTPDSVTWKRHISQPKTVKGTIEMMKKDAAFQLASGTAQWWMDLTDNGWFDAPEAVDPIRRLRGIEERLMNMERSSFGEIAFVVSQRSMMFQAPHEGLHNATLKMFRNWHLSRLGAPFEQLFVDDLARPDLPDYKLYILANLFYLSEAQRHMIDQKIKRRGATALWIYAPGYLDDQSASVENMHALTGIQLSVAKLQGELNVTLTDFDHPITGGLASGFAYGTGINREQYMQPPKIQYMPVTSTIQPAFYADDPQVKVLGTADSTGKAGLVVKELDGWRSIYSAAPLLPWPLMRNIARLAGVHLYSDLGDMVWANNAFLAVYSQVAGKHTIRFPRALDVEDAYENRILGRGVDALELDMDLWETKLFLMK